MGDVTPVDFQTRPMPVPMRVGEILDRSLRLAGPLALKVAVPLAISAGIRIWLLFQSSLSVILLVSFGHFIFCWLMSPLYIFIAAELWNGNSQYSLRDAGKRMRLGKYFGLIGLAIYIGFFGTLGLMAFIIPGFIYLTNRYLSTHVLLLENTSGGDAIKRSKLLMTGRSFLSPRGPAMRMSGMGICLVLLYLFPALIGGQAKTMATTQGTTYQLLILLNIGAIVLQDLVLLVAQIAFTGFYYDLRTRYEGIDLTPVEAPAREVA